VLPDRLARLPALDRGGCPVKRTDDPTGLQFLFTGIVAIALGLQLAWVFLHRLYTQRFDHQETNKDDQP
jgi:hypothetical protein